MYTSNIPYFPRWDFVQSVQQTKDGEYIIAGNTNSNDGDVSGNNGSSDYWIVKLDNSGDIVWQKCLGGSGDDIAASVQQTNDRGYIIAGYTNSTDGYVSGNNGSSDYWIVKLDDKGEIMWQKCLGGSGEDQANYVQQTKDGGYIIAGDTDSSDR